MINIEVPLRLFNGKLKVTNNIVQSIDAFLSLLIMTPLHESIVNREFGFLFNNLRFEIFNENEGVVYNSSNDDESLRLFPIDVYEKKISGSSKSLNTFAAELREAIARYEKRLDDVSVSISYIRDERLIYIAVKGIIGSTKEKYRFLTTLKVWN